MVPYILLSILYVPSTHVHKEGLAQSTRRLCSKPRERPNGRARPTKQSERRYIKSYEHPVMSSYVLGTQLVDYYFCVR